MRIIALAALITLSTSSALASFELALVLDRNNAADGSINTAIMRFDPETGTYLGEFGRGILNGNCTSMKLDQANNIVNVMEGNGTVMQFNYNTGAYLGEWTAAYSMAGSLGSGSNNRMLTSWGTGNNYILNFESNGQYTGFYYASVGAFWAYTYASDGRVYAFDNLGKNLASWNAGANYDLPSNSVSLAASTGNLVNGNKMVAQGNRLLLTGKGVGANTGYGYIITLSGGGNVSGVTQVTLPGSNTSTGVAAGHGDIAYYTGYNNVDPARVNRVNTATGRLRGYFGEMHLTKPQDIVVVVAPEPTSMVALGLGALALLRKRRRS